MMTTDFAQPNMLQLYARHAARWHRSITRQGYPDAYALLARADRDARTAAPSRVLDAGCGTGAFSEQFLLTCPPDTPLTLLDPSPEMLEQARQRAWRQPPETLSGTLGYLPELAQRFDTILCAHVLEHTPDLATSLQQLFGALKPCGALLLAVSKPHWCTALLRWRYGHRAYHPEEVCAALEKAGFVGITTHRFKKGPPSRTSCGYRAVRPPCAETQA